MDFKMTVEANSFNQSNTTGT